MKNRMHCLLTATYNYSLQTRLQIMCATVCVKKLWSKVGQSLQKSRHHNFFSWTLFRSGAVWLFHCTYAYEYITYTGTSWQPTLLLKQTLLLILNDGLFLQSHAVSFVPLSTCRKPYFYIQDTKITGEFISNLWHYSSSSSALQPLVAFGFLLLQ